MSRPFDDYGRRDDYPPRQNERDFNDRDGGRGFASNNRPRDQYDRGGDVRGNFGNQRYDEQQNRGNVKPNNGGGPSWEEQRRDGGARDDGQNKRPRYDVSFSSQAPRVTVKLTPEPILQDYDQTRQYPAPRQDNYSQSYPQQQEQQFQQFRQPEMYPQQQLSSRNGYEDRRDSNSSYPAQQEPVYNRPPAQYAPYSQSQPAHQQRQQQQQQPQRQQPPAYHPDPNQPKSRPFDDHYRTGGRRASPDRRFNDRDENRRDETIAPLESPSASVILLGLPGHCDDRGLRIFLEDLGASIDQTTVITDRTTGLSKRYGFAKFSSVEHARAFVEPNYPTVAWKEPAGMGPGLEDGLNIKINFSQKTGGWKNEQGSDPRISDNQRNQPDSRASPEGIYVNMGTRDIGSAHSQILLLRGLDTLTTEDEIVKALRSIPGRTGSDVRADGVHKVMITKDKASRGSWGFGFVQFADVRLATNVLAAVLNSEFHPTGFRVRSSVVAVSFCHENSFVPIYAASEWSFRGEGGQQLIYWDTKAFVNAWSPAVSVSTVPSMKARSPATGTGMTHEKQKETADDDMEAFFSSIEAEVPAISAAIQSAPASLLPVSAVMDTTALLESAAPPPKKIEAVEKKIETPVASSAAATSVVFPPAVVAPDIVLPMSTEDKLKASLKARKSSREHGEKSSQGHKKTKDNDLIETKKANVNISKWNVKQQELKLPSDTAPLPAPLPAPVPTAPKSLPVILTNVEVTAPDSLAFADKNVCLLCQRQFKDLPSLEKHNNLSALHKTNLASKTTVAEATLRKAAAQALALAASFPHSTSTDPAPAAYVDRSAKRREAFNQPETPKASSSSTRSSSKRSLPAPPPPPVVIRPNQDGIEASNVGSKMLEKMGWNKGDGLGSEKNGIVAPVIASSFAQGAGLGSSKGVAIGTYQDNSKGYAEKLRDSARSRLAKE